MSLTPSTMLPLGTIAPDFALLDTVSGEVKQLSQLQSDRATVVMFICNHCPYVLHILDRLIAVSREYQEKGVSFIAICANDAQAYPEDGPDAMREMALTQDFTFPYLHDDSQEIAKAYHAACTPDFFVFDEGLRCAYRGRFDSATPGKSDPVTGADLTAALDQVLAGESVPTEQQPSLGCSIKWR